MRNLADDPAYAERVATMRRLLDRERRRAGDPNMTGSDA